jgi:NADH-quinone oxidoreductase subunit F
MSRLTSIQDLEQLRQSILQQWAGIRKRIRVCVGTACHSQGGEKLSQLFEKILIEKGLSADYLVTPTGCNGFCAHGPIVVIEPDNIFYQRVKPDQVPAIIEKTVLGDELIEDLLYLDPETGKKVIHESEIPFYARQERIVFSDSGRNFITNIDDYISRGGYSALAKALGTMAPEEIIEEIKLSGLRGRGGGGFPTGTKWESCRKAKGELKYVMCNADEATPVPTWTGPSWKATRTRSWKG